MFRGIFYEKLKCARNDISGFQFIRNGYLHPESFREADLQKVVVLGCKVELFFKGHQLLLLRLEHVSVKSCELVDVGAGLLRLLFAHKAVENIEGVEQEVRIDLMLELEVAVFCYIGHALCFLCLDTGFQRVVDHEYDAVHRDFCKQGGYEKDREFVGECRCQTRRRSVTGQSHLGQGYEDDDSKQSQRLCKVVQHVFQPCVIPSDIQQVKCYHDHQGC